MQAVVDGMSDHDDILIDISLKPKFDKKQKPTRKVFQYRKENMEAVRKDLQECFREYLATDPQNKTIDENDYFFLKNLYRRHTTAKAYTPEKNRSAVEYITD